jgi:dihydroxyacetone kinase-like protein
MDLTRNEAAAIVGGIRRLMTENRDFLAELDGRVGDGDLGVTMTKAFQAADEEAKKILDPEPGRFFMKIGLAIAKAAPSTMGTLIATGFMRGGKAVGDKSKLAAEDLAVFFEQFVTGIQERGKARLGDKTILDVLKPAADALAANRTRNVKEALASAEQAAAEGLEKTKSMMSQHGKAAVFREKTIGIQDPGGTAGLLIVKAFRQAFGG